MDTHPSTEQENQGTDKRETALGGEVNQSDKENEPPKESPEQEPYIKYIRPTAIVRFRAWVLHGIQYPPGWINLSLGALGIVAGLWVAYVSHATLIVTQNAVKESNESFKATLNEMKAQSGAMNRSATAMEDSAAQIRRTAEAAASGNDIARDGNAINSEAVRIGQEAARQQLIIEQRAWIGLSDARIAMPIDRTKPLNASVKVTNEGISPAIDVSTFAAIVVSTSYPLPEAIRANPLPSNNVSRSVLFRGNTTGINARPGPVVAATPLKDFPGIIYIYLLGRVEYADIFGNKRFTDFCFYTLENRPESDLIVCATRNKID